jgi:hypothetical protein
MLANRVKKYGLNMLGTCPMLDSLGYIFPPDDVRAVSADDQVKAYIKKIMSQLDRWMVHGKISKLVIVITNKDTGEHVERWEFNVDIMAAPKAKKRRADAKGADQENVEPGYVPLAHGSVKIMV